MLRNDLIWPDDHFQALEPASHLVFHRAFLAWEWQIGYRSWSLPLLYAPILWVCKLFGITGGLIPIYAARCLNVLCAGWSLKRFLTLLELLNLDLFPKVATLFGFALLPAMLLWSPTCFADHWIMMTWMIVMPSLLKLYPQKDTISWFKLGLLAGLPLFFKYQAGLFSLALGIFFLSQKRTLKQLIAYSFGVMIYPLGLATLDAFTYHEFASSLLKQIQSGEQTSRFYGVAPFYDYFNQLIYNLGVTPFLFLGLSLIIPILFLRIELLNWLKKNKILLSILSLPLIFYFLIHSAIPHKETRFILPFFPLLFLCFGVGLQFSIQWIKKKYNFKHEFFSPIKYLHQPPLQLLFFFLSALFLFWITLKTPVYLTSVNIASLEARVYERQAEHLFPPQCLLLLNHNWSWTRGKLILGDGVQVIETSTEEYSPSEAPSCRYVILPRNKLRIFIEKTKQEDWEISEETPYGYLLLERKT